MQSGLLWFDNSPGRGLADKVADAARRYREKFGAAPDTCYSKSDKDSGCAIRNRGFSRFLWGMRPTG
ncbi:MAG: hypothetical protein FJ011_14325 [Chloroflexi bacterium]|nr:hypothetical protein [Chloroflexota bacterium]